MVYLYKYLLKQVETRNTLGVDFILAPLTHMWKAFHKQYARKLEL